MLVVNDLRYGTDCLEQFPAGIGDLLDPDVSNYLAILKEDVAVGVGGDVGS